MTHAEQVRGVVRCRSCRLNDNAIDVRVRCQGQLVDLPVRARTQAASRAMLKNDNRCLMRLRNRRVDVGGLLYLSKSSV